jgi:hypothetical protein
MTHTTTTDHQNHVDNTHLPSTPSSPPITAAALESGPLRVVRQVDALTAPRARPAPAWRAPGPPGPRPGGLVAAPTDPAAAPPRGDRGDSGPRGTCFMSNMPAAADATARRTPSTTNERKSTVVHPLTDPAKRGELTGSGRTTTMTVRTTASLRAAAAVGVAGALVLVAASLLQVIDALVAADFRLAYRTVPETAAGLMLVGTLVALGHSGAVGHGRGARSGLVLAALGWVSFAVAQVGSQLRGGDFTPAFIVSTLLLVVGMTAVGVAALRRRMWTGWTRWLPLLSGTYLIAAAPLLGSPGATGELAIAGWGVLWLVLGLVLVRRPRAHWRSASSPG